MEGGQKKSSGDRRKSTPEPLYPTPGGEAESIIASLLVIFKEELHMSKQSVSKSGKVVQFPGTQPFMYEGRNVCLTIGIWTTAKGSKKFSYDEKNDCYWISVTATCFEHGRNLINQIADEMGICL